MMNHNHIRYKNAQNQTHETRFEPKYEQDARANHYRHNDRSRHHSPQRYTQYRSLDYSPQRYNYDRSMDPRANPHSDVYDPRFNPNSPLPAYHEYPQPQYQRNPADTDHPEQYAQKKFDYRNDDRFYRQEEDRQFRPQQQSDRNPPSWQPEFAPKVQYRHGEDVPTGGYDGVPPAGRANVFNTRITDLLTSIREPEKKDDRQTRLMEANKGYLVMLRFRPQDLSDVINAIQSSVSTLTSHDGYCIGFSQPGNMRIILSSNQMMAKDQWWDARDIHSRQSKSKYSVCCFWFKDYLQARSWFQTGNTKFKQPEFPNSSPYQIVCVPLTYGRNKDPIPFGPESGQITLLWTEFPTIYERNEHDFLVNYSEPTRRIMKSYGGNPNISVSRYKAGEPPDLNKFGSPGYARLEVPVERVGRSWRNSWLVPDTFVTISTFPSMDDVRTFYNDDEYQRVKDQLSRYSDAVMVAITLQTVQGTSRR